jgi:recombination DNA repair RAD52 pathway protein
LETNRAISFANEIFGYGGWASQIVNISTDYVCQICRNYSSNNYNFLLIIIKIHIQIDEVGTPPYVKYNAGVSAIVRLQLKDGTHHEGI